MVGFCVLGDESSSAVTRNVMVSRVAIVWEDWRKEFVNITPVLCMKWLSKGSCGAWRGEWGRRVSLDDFRGGKLLWNAALFLKKRYLKTCFDVTHFVISQGWKLMTICLVGCLISWYIFFFYGTQTFITSFTRVAIGRHPQPIQPSQHIHIFFSQITFQ